MALPASMGECYAFLCYAFVLSVRDCFCEAGELLGLMSCISFVFGCGVGCGFIIICLFFYVTAGTHEDRG